MVYYSILYIIYLFASFALFAVKFLVGTKI